MWNDLCRGLGYLEESSKAYEDDICLSLRPIDIVAYNSYSSQVASRALQMRLNKVCYFHSIYSTFHILLCTFSSSYMQ